MDIKKCSLILTIIGLCFFLFDILTLALSIWTTKAIRILYYIYFAFISIYYLFLFLSELSLNINFLNKIKETINKHIVFVTLIFFIINFLEFILLSINVTKFMKFWKNCPYIMSDLDYSLHYKRRCELYNIHNNSRYSYQYICSYDSSKDFNYKSKLKEEVNPEIVRCVQVNNLIEDNEIIELFSNEYSKNNNYYCSRADKPEKYSFAKNKDCTRTKYSLMVVFLFFSLFQIYFQIVYIKYLKLKYNIERRRNFHVRINRFRNERLHFGNERNNREDIEIHHLINFGRLLNLMRDLININLNNLSDSNCPTEVSVNQNRNNAHINFERENTKNIVIENQKNYSIDSNIKNMYTEPKKNEKNSIDLDNIGVSIGINSEETKIKITNSINNNIKNNQ